MIRLDLVALAGMSDAQLARVVQDGSTRLHRLTDSERDDVERAYEMLERRRRYRPCASSDCPEHATYRVHGMQSTADFCAEHAAPARLNILVTVTEIDR